MFDVFAIVKDFLKLDSVCIDNTVFRLHYKATAIILLAFSAIVVSKQYIGDPIDCQQENLPEEIIDTYCWIHSTYILKETLSETDKSKLPHSGFGHNHNRTKIHQNYYQWVCFFLILQFVMFYIPRKLWKSWEGGRLVTLTEGLTTPIVGEEEYGKRKDLLITYFKEHCRSHQTYFGRFLVCEVLNFINVVGQIYFMDRFFDGEFKTYGTDLISFVLAEDDDRIDPINKLFPKVTKCVFRSSGVSGTIQNADALCILPLNIVNEKIIVFLWFWYIFVAVLSAMALVARIVQLFQPQIRNYMLKHRSGVSIDNISIGDWFLLYQMGKSIDPILYKDVMNTLSQAIVSHQ